MIVRRFARPYAKAIIEAAGSTERASQVREEMARFDEVRRSSEELREVFENPGIALDAKLNIAKSISDRLRLTELGQRVIEVLIRNNRINQLDAITAAVASYVNQATGTVVAEVKSAHALSQQEADDLRKTLEKKTGKQVQLEVTTQPELLGGFVARIGSEIYDASVSGKINKFRDSLT